MFFGEIIFQPRSKHYCFSKGVSHNGLVVEIILILADAILFKIFRTTAWKVEQFKFVCKASLSFSSISSFFWVNVLLFIFLKNYPYLQISLKQLFLVYGGKLSQFQIWLALQDDYCCWPESNLIRWIHWCVKSWRVNEAVNFLNQGFLWT